MADFFDNAFEEFGVDPSQFQGAPYGGNTGFTGGMDPSQQGPITTGLWDPAAEANIQGGPYARTGPYLSPEQQAANLTAYNAGPKGPAAQPNNQQTIDNFWSAVTQQGRTSLSPQDLAQLVQQNPGVSFLPGSQDKVRLPNGQVVDPIGDVGGANKPQWSISGGQPGENGQPMSTPSGGGGGASGNAMYQPGGYQFGGGSGSMGSMAMPSAPNLTNLQASSPFAYGSLGDMGRFQGPNSAPSPSQLSYNPMQAPDAMQAGQVSQPGQLSYNQMQSPTPWSAAQQGQPAQLNYTGLSTPSDFQYQDYKGPSAADMAADPGMEYRQKAQRDALEQTAATHGVLRTGGTALDIADKSGQLASQEYGNVWNRGFQQNQANNQGRLGAAQTNAQTGLAYNQNANQNALNFGQANIGNAFNATQANNATNLAASNSNFQNANLVNQQNNAGNFQVGQANINNALNATQANNQSNLAYGNQNFQNAFNVNQANNAGGFQSTQANNQNAQNAQAQQFGQAATGFGLNLGAQNQGYNQALGTYGMNAQNQLAFGQANNQNALSNYQAQGNLALGLGNLNLGYTQAGNNYNLGLGNLGVSQGNLALGQQGQAFNQGLQTFNTNYQTQVQDPWNRNFALASLGNPSQNNGLTAGQAAGGANTIEGQGNVNAAGQAAQANAWAGLAGNLGQYGWLYGA